MADLRELERCLGAMYATLDDLEAFTEADIAFHAALMSAADNSFVSALFEPLAALMRDVRRATSLGRDAREGGIAWHTKILDAVRARRAPRRARRWKGTWTRRRGCSTSRSRRAVCICQLPCLTLANPFASFARGGAEDQMIFLAEVRARVPRPGIPPPASCDQEEGCR